tara:strand:- start:86 stop:265 length:180 start_codon:yes stop_codon:yes gene_type:complete
VEDRVRPQQPIKKGFFNHSANNVYANGPIYGIMETKEVISIEEFQEFIDGHIGPGFGLN